MKQIPLPFESRSSEYRSTSLNTIQDERHTLQAKNEKIAQTYKLQSELKKYIETPFEITVNNNSSHFVTVHFNHKMRPTFASIHALFASAPSPILKTLAEYINTQGKNPLLTHELRTYITTASRKKRERKEIQIEGPVGQVYNLDSIMQSINATYFTHTPISTSITWFQHKRNKRPTRKCSLGLYFEELNLIKINSILDSPIIPEYVVNMIIYHEMLHAIYPPKISPSGRRIIHTSEFQEAEKNHAYFLDAEAWLKENQYLFFSYSN